MARIGPSVYGRRAGIGSRIARLSTRGTTHGVPIVVNGLIFPSNFVSNGNIGLDWTGADMVARNSHTAIWKANYVQQSGYYAWAWHVRADDTYVGDMYPFGTHPYPASDGTVSSTGDSESGTGGAGTVHYHEIAGLTSNDFLCSPGGAGGVLVTKGIWYTQARTAEVVNISGTDYVRHRYWPDLDNDPSFVIQQDKALTSLNSPPTMKFRFGASPWTVYGSANGECPSGTFRHLLLYDTALSLAEIQVKIARTTDDTTSNDSRCWYSNINPTPDDVSDKSGAGHSPSWANANRPTLYTG